MPAGPKLSSSWNTRSARYDFVIAGSGYGGSITAARLATAAVNPKPTVCILERGREWPVGKFPDTLEACTAELRFTNPLGLYDLLNYPDLAVIKGNGLGGTSLINANVAIVPQEEAFEQAGWPASLNALSLATYYDRARAVLRPSKIPDFANLPKRQALAARAAELGLAVEALDIAVTFEDTADNGSGVSQPACTRCGDCVTGCNVGSKNTLYMNYLPMAKRGGAKIFTQSQVDWLEPLPGGGWRIHGTRRRDSHTSEAFTMEAGQVILSAGSINSTEILLRSAAHGLSLSPRAGTGFSGNGDFFGVAYNGVPLVRVLGFGKHPGSPGAQHPPGPTITMAVKHLSGQLEGRFLVEDVSFPRGLVGTAQVTFAGLPGEEFGGPDLEKVRRVLNDVLQLDRYSADGALNHSILFLVTGFDNAQGRIRLDHPDGDPTVVWENAGSAPNFAAINAELRQYARSLSARFVENPIWAAFDTHRLFTAHPLGGCPIGSDPDSGAVDEFGRVFSADGSLHSGLRVCDGALLPTALGVNPLLTISALAERIAENIIASL